MATLDDVSRLARALPDVTEDAGHGQRPGLSWTVGGKVFAWQRAFSKADIKRYGDTPVPSGTIVALVVEDLGEKEAVLSSDRPGFFTIPHFNGFAAVLVELDAVRDDQLAEAVVDAWLAVAPPVVAQRYLADR
jgi:hypothetical protein